MSRLAHLAKGIAALVLLAALVAGIPFALWHYIGWPLPHHVPSTGQIGHVLDSHGIAGRTLVDVLAVVVWVTWAVLVASVAAEIPAALAGRRARRLPVAGVFQPLTGRLVAAVVVAALALAPRPAHSQPVGSPGTGLVALRRPVAALVLTGNSRPALPHAPPTAPPGADTSPSGAPVASLPMLGPSGPAPHPSPGTQVADQMRTYVVQRGDTLWGIAERELGDPLRWSQIYALNEGRPQPGGASLTDPHWIDPGWTLLLPTSVATVIPPTAAPSPPPSSPPPSPPEPGPGRASAPATNRPTIAAPPSSAVPPATPPPAEPPVRTVPDWTGHPLVPAQVNGNAAHPVDRSSGSVRLPSGSVVGGSFVAGVLSAVALGRLRRRHAYRYRPPEPGRHLGPDPLRPTLRRLASARCRDVEPGDVSAGDADESAAPMMAPPPGVSLLADDDPEHRERPDLVEVGTRDGHTVEMALSELGGVTLAGPDASQVAAAWVASLMVRAGPRAAEVVMTRPALDELFGPGALPGPVPGLRVVDGPEAILSSLERMVLSRARQLTEDGVPDVVAYRRANPWEPVPMVLAVIDEVPGTDAGRWAATVAAGPRLGFAVFTCDPHAAMPARLVMGADRVVSTGVPDELAARLIGVELFALRADEAADAVATLAETEERPDSTDTDAGITAPEETAWPPFVSSPEVTPAEPSTPLHVVPDNDALPIEPPEPSIPPETAPVGVTVFGPYEIAVDGEVVSKGLRSVAKELLAWLCLRPEGASVEAAVDALWPDTERSQVHKQFWQAATNLRTRLGTAGDPGTKVLVLSGDVYRLDPAALACDLWVFQDALGVAARAEDDRVARVALRRAVDAYRGDLLVGTDYPWVEPVRQDLHRRATDAHLRLAEIDARLDAPDAAEETLRRAIDLDRYAEEPYRRLMALQGKRGRPDAVADTWRLLRNRLEEIDVDPEPATLRLYRSLTSPQETPADRACRARLSP